MANWEEGAAATNQRQGQEQQQHQDAARMVTYTHKLVKF